MAAKLKFLRAIFLVALLQLTVAVPLLPAREPESALLIKTSFLLNFLKFTQWPPSAFPVADQKLVLAVLGESPIAAKIKTHLDGRPIRNKPVQVILYADVQLWQQARKMPHALFVTQDMAGQWSEILVHVTAAPVLTMADFSGFCAQGGILNLVRDGDSIGFEANPEAAKKVSLMLNAQMLHLAELVSTQTK